MPFEHREQLSSEEWCEKAREKALSFLEDIDRGLRVEVKEETIMPLEGMPYDAQVLHFTHLTNHNIEWTMPVNESDEFLEEEFENAVRRAYYSITKEMPSKMIH